MALRNFTVERGLRIHSPNDSSVHVDFIQGTGAPGGDGDIQDAASIGSIYANRSAGGGLYKKVDNSNALADWEEVGNVSLGNLSWRNERVIAATNDTLAAGSGIDPNGWSDNEQGLGGNDMVVGEYLIGDADGTPALFEITAITSDTDITIAAAAQPYAQDDTYVVQNYLPDTPAGQEGQAIVHAPTATSLVKVADINWALADGINLTAGYAAANGTVAPSDTVEAAIQKLDGNQIDLITLSGEAQGAVDHGTFTGAVIEDNRDTHEALQDLEDSLENVVTLSGVALDATDLGTFTGSIIEDNRDNKEAFQDLEDSMESLVTLSGVALDAVDLGTFTGNIIPDNSDNKEALQALETEIETIENQGKVTGITTLADVDTVLVDDYHEIEWEVVVFEEATPSNKEYMKISGLHDGTAAADATVVDFDKFSKKKVGSNFNLVVSIDLNGTGGAQTMRLRASSSTAGVTVEFRRNGVKIG